MIHKPISIRMSEIDSSACYVNPRRIVFDSEQLTLIEESFFSRFFCCCSKSQKQENAQANHIFQNYLISTKGQPLSSLAQKITEVDLSEKKENRESLFNTELNKVIRCTEEIKSKQAGFKTISHYLCFYFHWKTLKEKEDTDPSNRNDATSDSDLSFPDTLPPPKHQFSLPSNRASFQSAHPSNRSSHDLSFVSSPRLSNRASQEIVSPPLKFQPEHSPHQMESKRLDELIAELSPFVLRTSSSSPVDQSLAFALLSWNTNRLATTLRDEDLIFRLAQELVSQAGQVLSPPPVIQDREYQEWIRFVIQKNIEDLTPSQYKTFLKIQAAVNPVDNPLSPKT